MLKLDEIIIRVLIALAAIGGLWFVGSHYLASVEQRGYDRAVADGKKVRQIQADQALNTERDLRALLAIEQAQRFKESQDHAKNIADLQAAARSGAERLRCPVSRTIPATTTPADRSIATGSESTNGSELMPEASADIFGIAGGIAEVVRQRNALIVHFNAARAACMGLSLPGAGQLPVDPQN